MMQASARPQFLAFLQSALQEPVKHSESYAFMHIARSTLIKAPFPCQLTTPHWCQRSEKFGMGHRSTPKPWRL